MKKSHICYILGATMLLAGCGGGSDSSSGGGQAAVTNQQGPHTGTYNGSYTLTVSGPGGSVSGSGPMSLVVNSDGTVVLDPNSSTPGHGSLSGDSFTVRYPATLVNSPGVSCTGTITVSGTGSGGVFNGKIGPGTIKCNGVTISYNGTLKLSRIAKSYSAGSPVRQFFRQAVIRHK